MGEGGFPDWTAVLPVWLIAEDPGRHQFDVALDASQRVFFSHGNVEVRSESSKGGTTW